VKTKRKAGVAWHKVVVGAVSVVGAAAYASVLASMMSGGLLDRPHVEIALVGFASGALFWTLLRKRLGFFGVFEHEFTHLVMGLLMLQKPEAFFATASRGHVRVGGKNFLVDLAPYYFPTFSVILLLVYPLLKASAHPAYFAVLGFITGYHLVSHVIDFRFHQGDIRVSGRVFSVVFCLFAGLLAFGFILAFVVGGYRGGWEFVKAGPPEAGRLLVLAWESLLKFLGFATAGQGGSPAE